MSLYFNEFEKYPSQWLRNLYPKGIIDERSIADVTPNELLGYERCHFFAGIGGWQYALELAGWPVGVPVWTGSCPCQPFSDAGKQQGSKDPRHLWPEFGALIGVCRPPVIFGEQVASKIGRTWLDGVSLDLEEMGYAVGSADLCAAGINAPHIRQRLFWVAYTKEELQRTRKSGSVEAIKTGGCNSNSRLSNPESNRRHQSQSELSGPDERDRASGNQRSASGGVCSGMANPSVSQRNQDERSSEWQRVEPIAGRGGLGDAECEGPQGYPRTKPNWDQPRWLAAEPNRPAATTSILCTDGKHRRVPLPESGIQPLAYGIPRGLGKGRSKDQRMAISAARNCRVGQLKGYGNAIVPHLAAMFIRAFMDKLFRVPEIANHERGQ